MEDLKQIQEFFSKPLEESKQLDQVDFAKVVQAVTKTGHPVTVLLVPKFNEIEVITGMNAPDDMLFDLSNAVDSLGYGYNVIIAGDSSNLSRREYSDIRRVNGGAKDYFEESVNEAYIVTYAKNKGEKPSSVAYKHRDSALAFERDLKKDGYITMLTQRPVDGVDEATKGEENEFHKELDKLVHKTFGHSSDEKKKMKEYNSGIYYNPTKDDTADKAKEAGDSALKKVKDMIQKILKEEEGYSKYLKTDDNPEGKTKGLDTKTMNKILMNVIKDLDELKQLGEGVIEEELCAKGKAYIKKRQAAGEKSSAYLSGRAVKVCKGQMKG